MAYHGISTTIDIFRYLCPQPKLTGSKTFDLFSVELVKTGPSGHNLN